MNKTNYEFEHKLSTPIEVNESNKIETFLKIEKLYEKTFNHFKSDINNILEIDKELNNLRFKQLFLNIDKKECLLEDLLEKCNIIFSSSTQTYFIEVEILVIFQNFESDKNQEMIDKINQWFYSKMYKMESSIRHNEY